MKDVAPTLRKLPHDVGDLQALLHEKDQYITLLEEQLLLWFRPHSAPWGTGEFKFECIRAANAEQQNWRKDRSTTPSPAGNTT